MDEPNPVRPDPVELRPRQQGREEAAAAAGKEAGAEAAKEGDGGDSEWEDA